MELLFSEGPETKAADLGRSHTHIFIHFNECSNVLPPLQVMPSLQLMSSSRVHCYNHPSSYVGESIHDLPTLDTASAAMDAIPSCCGWRQLEQCLARFSSALHAPLPFPSSTPAGKVTRSRKSLVNFIDANFLLSLTLSVLWRNWGKKVRQINCQFQWSKLNDTECLFIDNPHFLPGLLFMPPVYPFHSHSLVLHLLLRNSE